MKPTTKKPRPLSWYPHRKVDGTYCSAACGHGCTYAEFQKAKRAAAALAGLLGMGFKPRVWENLGWHYEAVSRDGTMKVSPSIDRMKEEVVGYTAYFGEPGPGGRWAESDKNLWKALRKVLEKARAEAAGIRDLLHAYAASQPKVRRAR